MHVYFAVIVGIIDTFEHKARLVLDALKLCAQLFDELLCLLLQLCSGDTRDPVTHNTAIGFIKPQVRNIGLQYLHCARLHKDGRHIDLIGMRVPHGRGECGRIGKRAFTQNRLCRVVVFVEPQYNDVDA